MTAVRETAGGGVRVDAARYSLEVRADGTRAALSAADGGHLATICLLAALDRADGPDETLAVEAPRVVGRTASAAEISIARRSTLWRRARLILACAEDELELRVEVEGDGRLTDVHLLGGRSLVPGRATGFFPSGAPFRTLFSPNPGDPARLTRDAAETAVIGATGDGGPGRGHWFFTPAPLFVALAEAEAGDPEDAVDRGWLGIGIAAPLPELTFSQLVYVGGDGAFSLRLEYDGHTAADGGFSAPPVVLSPGLPGPYDGLRAHRASLVVRGAAPEPRPRDAPAWWREPIFCGWGAQCHLARDGGRPAPALSTQGHYDGFLAELERRGVVPGTVVVDDKWQDAYGTNAPDGTKWPDLRGWIAAQHGRGRHVLLWWKAWDPEGLPAELCIRNPDGGPVAVDPTHPGARAAVRDSIERMLGPDGLDADGLKVDFTGSTPAGRALSTYGGGWGIALLHELLALVYRTAKRAKPDALVITHTPNPAFVDVTDMIRLNDMLRLDDPGPIPDVLPQMRYRAAVARAACPELLIDTDDWCVPDLRAWREYLALKPDLGVPALYYATHLDRTGESFTDDDYERLRGAWADWRARWAA